MTRFPISVLFFSRVPVWGGAEEHMLTLLRGLDRRLFRLHLACPTELADKIRPQLPPDVNLFPLTLSKAYITADAFRLAKILRDTRIKILHSHMSYSSRFASVIGRLCRVPVIIETPHVRELWRTSLLKSSYLVDRIMGRFVDYYVAVSEANARYLAKTKGLPLRKIRVIVNGTDLRRFSPGRPVPAGFREKLGFAPGDPILMVLGRLEAQKGHRVLIEAMPAVLRQFPKTRLVCLGEGRLREELEKQTEALGLCDSIRFVGHQSNVEDWLALADFTVLPSFFEGLPLVAIESLAVGRPVVATAVDGTPEVVVDGKTGLIVPPGDPALLAHAICNLLHDSGRREGMARAGRQWVIERFDQNQQIERTQELYLQASEQYHGGRVGVNVAIKPSVVQSEATIPRMVSGQRNHDD